MDYFNNFLAMFLSLDRVNYMSSRISSKISQGVFTHVDRLLYSETGIKIITMLLFILGAVCFQTAKFLNGPKLSRASKLSSHWSKFHGARMTINDSFGKRVGLCN